MPTIEVTWVDSHSLPDDWMTREEIDRLTELVIVESRGQIYAVKEDRVIIYGHRSSEDMYCQLFVIPRIAVRSVRFL